jgi:DNA polymerase V
MSMFALVDCNNFYASCERVFQPKLEGRPVIVLSNNDGCVIALSNESKKLGIGMGVPFFKVRPIVERYGVAVRSSNYELYGDMSQRVMQTLMQLTSDVEIYSIDEAFCDLSGFLHRDLNEYAWEMKDTIKRWTGLPVGVGIGATKTLAKIANNAAKKANGVVVLNSEAITKAVLAMTPVRDIWGIGRQHDRLLERYGIRTAWEFAQARDSWIREHLHITGLRTAQELRGIPCIPLEEQPPAKKNITMSRMFGHPVTKVQELEEAICTYATRAAEKLRREGLHANTMLVFFHTSPFKDGFTGASCAMTLPRATSYTPDLARYATAAVRQEYRPGNAYIKAGLILGELTSPSHQQQTLFEEDTDDQKLAVMQALDTVNRRWGRNTLFYAGSGIQKRWHMRRERKSPSYTTRIDELLRVL